MNAEIWTGKLFKRSHRVKRNGWASNRPFTFLFPQSSVVLMVLYKDKMQNLGEDALNLFIMIWLRETTQLCCRLKCQVYQQMLLSSTMHIWRLHYFPLLSLSEHWQFESFTCYYLGMKWFCRYKNKKMQLFIRLIKEIAFANI